MGEGKDSHLCRTPSRCVRPQSCHAQSSDVVDFLYSYLKAPEFEQTPQDVNVYLVPAPQVNIINNAPQLVPSLKFERVRLHTFTAYPTTANKSTILLSSHGFVYSGSGTGQDDSVTCAFCKAEYKGWQVQDDIAGIHARLSQTCPMVTGTECGNVPFHSPVNSTEPSHRLWQRHSVERSETSNRDYIESDVVPIEDITDSVHTPVICVTSSSETSQARSDNTSHAALIVNTSVPTSSNPQATAAGNGTVIAPSGSLLGSPWTTVHSGSSQASHQVAQIAQPVSSSASPPQTTPTTIASLTPASVGTLPTTTYPAAASMTNADQSAPGLMSPSGNSEIASSEKSKGSTSAATPISYYELGIITEMPKRSEFAHTQRRRDSFKCWPSDHFMDTNELVKAGFYYAGYSDCVRCFFCGGGLREWEPEDNVWVEHAKWFPKCAYLRRTAGHEFIEQVLKRHMENENISFDDVLKKLGTTAREFHIGNKEYGVGNDPAVKACIALGFSRDDVTNAALSLKSEEDKTISSEHLLKKLVRNVSEEKLQQQMQGIQSVKPKSGNTVNVLKRKIEDVRRQITCKVCLVEPVSVLFLPCGHLTCCNDCAASLKQCPLCRKDIKGVVGVFLS